MYSAVLLPTDGSDGALAGVRVGLEVAARSDATAHALFVIDERHVTREYDLVVEEAEREAELALDRVGELGDDLGLGVEKHLRWGIPHEEVIAAVAAYDADLVVMATHGRTGLDRFVHLGSVTERVVRSAPVQVLTVPVHGRRPDG